MEEGFAQNL